MSQPAFHTPRILASGNHAAEPFGWTSYNWSGYAITDNEGTVTQVMGEWSVPTVRPSHLSSSYSACWVGIDGFNNSSLIQAGTEQDASLCSESYYAWWEILPNPSQPIDPNTYPVFPDDRVSVSITRGADGRWTISIQNHTQSWAFTQSNLSYAGPSSSAEWIVEAPLVNGRIARLAHYSQIPFSTCQINGHSPELVMSDGGVLIQCNRQVSTPSAPNPNGDGFNMAYGSRQPSAPSSQVASIPSPTTSSPAP